MHPAAVDGPRVPPSSGHSPPRTPPAPPLRIGAGLERLAVRPPSLVRTRRRQPLASSNGHFRQPQPSTPLSRSEADSAIHPSAPQGAPSNSTPRVFYSLAARFQRPRSSALPVPPTTGLSSPEARCRYLSLLCAQPSVLARPEQLEVGHASLQAVLQGVLRLPTAGRPTPSSALSRRPSLHARSSPPATVPAHSGVALPMSLHARHVPCHLSATSHCPRPIRAAPSPVLATGVATPPSPDMSRLPSSIFCSRPPLFHAPAAQPAAGLSNRASFPLGSSCSPNYSRIASNARPCPLELWLPPEPVATWRLKQHIGSSRIHSPGKDLCKPFLVLTECPASAACCPAPPGAVHAIPQLLPSRLGAGQAWSANPAAPALEDSLPQAPPPSSAARRAPPTSAPRQHVPQRVWPSTPLLPIGGPDSPPRLCGTC
mmetsp:Transcript_5211/g.14415  ORF Transcript_5211/g.14415 Transcript_5211/m.14415 type:complete len:428 (+) Transcript_5211:400-1683(+)